MLFPDATAVPLVFANMYHFRWVSYRIGRRRWRIVLRALLRLFGWFIGHFEDSVMSERTYQQKLVWDRLSRNFEFVSALNQKLESRATLITTGSAAIVGVVSAAKFLPSTADRSASVESVLLGLVCCCAISMFWYGSRVWMPHLKATPGSTDPKVLYDKYIALSEDVAFNNALIDLGEAVDVGIRANNVKANAVTNMVRVLQLQLLLLAFAVSWSGITGLCGL